jgi:F-type H+-transporting ATPase subunit a
MIDRLIMTRAAEASGMPTLVPDKIPGTNLTGTAITASAVVALILLFALIVRVFCIPRWRKKRSPGALQTVLESVVGMFEREGQDAVGHNAKYLAPWYLGCCGLIFFGTLTELFGFRPPLTDMNVTLALGASTFVFMIVFGVKEKKAKFFGRYKIVIPILTDAVVPVSMALRLFGSVFSGYVIMHLIYSATDAIQIGGVAPLAVGLPALALILTTLFHAFIQTYVFMMLSYAFVSETTE